MQKVQVILHHVIKEGVFACRVPSCALSVEFAGVVDACIM
jgi:hypothetical protein